MDILRDKYVFNSGGWGTANNKLISNIKLVVDVHSHSFGSSFLCRVVKTWNSHYDSEFFKRGVKKYPTRPDHSVGAACPYSH